MVFCYAQTTTRNSGIVTPDEQARRQAATVFVGGTGGMGHLILADIDSFAVLNLNRQVFAFGDTQKMHKAEATAMLIRRINCAFQVTVYKSDYPLHSRDCIARSAVLVNGTDDLGAALLWYRAARDIGKSVIDASAAPLPSVDVTAPTDPPHEQRLGYPTAGTDWNKITPGQRALAILREAEHVMLHAFSRAYVDLAMVADVVAGHRARLSFAAMVITTGLLMADEVVNAVPGRPRGADNRGWFFRPCRAWVEKPRNALTTAILRPFVRRVLARFAGCGRMPHYGLICIGP